MFKHFFTPVVIAVFLLVCAPFNRALAQDNDVVWVQVEAQPSLAEAQDRARAYAARLPDVNGFAMTSGWYAIALGPYAREDANQVLRVYRSEGTIPRDSFIAFSSSFRQQFWPVGENLLNRGVLAPPVISSLPQPEANLPSIIQTTPDPADETPTEARRSEAQLSRPDREALQVALKWAGFYDSTIDGAFGRGTRNSMAAWQQANGFESTGILTTAQRAALLDQYNAVLKGMDLKLVRDTQAGIEIMIPTGVVAFEKYEPPFAHYAATGDLDAQVLLISQAGDQATLFGLYDIMQTLEIVPLTGPRERDSDSFRLIGESGMMISQTEAWLENGEIKGFTLVWPAGDEERRRRVLGEMQKSFARLGGVLDPSIGADAQQSIDLVAGLEVRKPRLSRSGFFVDRAGTVVTTADAVESCTRITLDDEHDANVLTLDTKLGVAVVQPATALAPLGVARFAGAVPRLQSDVAVGGYSYEGILGAPTVTFGTLSDLRGLAGEDQIKRLALTPLPGDAGGPVLDTGGHLLGMLLPRSNSDQTLPEDVNFAVNGAAIKTVLDAAGLSVNAVDRSDPLPVEDIRERASGMTVLVSCWD
ncbi:peptidoglycan-binding protein [Sulfitobacter sp. JL08]|uniref:serine protease n=1 Tax=Sulfitobacter sp. JL08 TaxID=2070369 RepID=UPI000E0B441A|nr:serine protease [Sulfitobacter sp. JL08]AXI54045.1 peptidoglycan-binding protein [Sulfitobacter sp. JL08]